MVTALISSTAVVLVAIIEALSLSERKHEKRRQARAERLEQDRARESKLAMQMMDASLDLGLATALAVEQHKFNGELKAAKEKASAAQEEYRVFVLDIASRQIAKV
ncbi:MAG: hypothetical protein EOM54_13460 [Clostridia bacterium]|nr:hypothetical protein [Clostridia bacterium]